MIKISYTDDKRGLLGFGSILPNIGADTLKIHVNDQDGTELDSKTITGSGEVEISIPVDSTMISVESIEAETKEKAEQILDERFEYEDEIFEVAVSVQTGEGPILKFFGWLREKLFGNDQFDLEITYDYTEYSIEQPDVGDDDDDDDTELNMGTQTYATLGLAGGKF
jgi:hypothetical protein